MVAKTSSAAQSPGPLCRNNMLSFRNGEEPHARSGDRIAIAAYLGKTDTFDNALAAFAIAYADQTERDHQALVAAVKSGRIQAETGL